MILQTNSFVAGVQLFSSIVLAVATGVLAYVTWEYSEQSKLQTKQSKAQTTEMEKTRKSNYRPVLQPSIENWTGCHHRFIFKNTGMGAAHDVTARWGFSHLDYEEEWRIPLISPDDQHNFIFPFEPTSNSYVKNGELDKSDVFVEVADLEERLDEEATLHFGAEYTDPLGNEYETSEELPVLEIARSGADIEQTQKDELQLIRKELEK